MPPAGARPRRRGTKGPGSPPGPCASAGCDAGYRNIAFMVPKVSVSVDTGAFTVTVTGQPVAL